MQYFYNTLPLSCRMLSQRVRKNCPYSPILKGDL